MTSLSNAKRLRSDETEQAPANSSSSHGVSVSVSVVPSPSSAGNVVADQVASAPKQKEQLPPVLITLVKQHVSVYLNTLKDLQAAQSAVSKLDSCIVENVAPRSVQYAVPLHLPEEEQAVLLQRFNQMKSDFELSVTRLLREGRDASRLRLQSVLDGLPGKFDAALAAHLAKSLESIHGESPLNVELRSMVQRQGPAARTLYDKLVNEGVQRGLRAEMNKTFKQVEFQNTKDRAAMAVDTVPPDKLVEELTRQLIKKEVASALKAKARPQKPRAPKAKPKASSTNDSKSNADQSPKNSQRLVVTPHPRRVGRSGGGNATSSIDASPKSSGPKKLGGARKGAGR